ncbi:DUF3040 domain-containing protein [Actinophytocola sp. NPDC049390]|uniref:DUF3040 domain-containing protein n=1 Tax=Actinophytocola sp. NPDC049390 TaxID=3363894 RepID=UPI0037A2DEB3
MLSEREQQVLRDIQRHLCVDDPDFERPFRVFEDPAPSSRYRWAYTTLVVITAVLAVGMLLTGVLGGAVAFAIAACTLWWTRHLEFASTRPERDG